MASRSHRDRRPRGRRRWPSPGRAPPRRSPPGSCSPGSVPRTARQAASTPGPTAAPGEQRRPPGRHRRGADDCGEDDRRAVGGRRRGPARPTRQQDTRARRPATAGGAGPPPRTRTSASPAATATSPSTTDHAGGAGRARARARVAVAARPRPGDPRARWVLARAGWSRASPRPGQRATAAARHPLDRLARPGGYQRAHMRRLASDGLVRRTSRDRLAVDHRVQHGRVLVAGLDHDVAVGGDHHRVAGVARAGLPDPDHPDGVLDGTGAQQGAPVLDLALAGHPGRRAPRSPRRPARRGRAASSGKRRS